MDLKERHRIDCLSRHPWEISRGKVIADILRGTIDGVANILDIGCGDLFLEECLSQYYPESCFFCVDIAFTEEEVTFLNQKQKNISVYNDLKAFAAENQQVDVILLLDVLEHIEDPLLFLNQLLDSPFVTKDTYLLITVPAFQGLYTSHDRFLGHYRRYCLGQLKDLLCKVRLENRQSGYFYFTLLLPRFLQRLKEKWISEGKGTTGLVEWKGGKMLTGGLCWVLTMDYRIGKFFRKMGIGLPGLSNYVLCKKEPV